MGMYNSHLSDKGKSLPKRGTVLVCGPGRTKQSFRERVNINSIISRYRKTGMLDQVAQNNGVFMDVSKYGDLHAAMQQIEEAKQAFLALPSDVRTRFGNDPAELVSFLQNDNNRAEAVELGLIDEAKVATGKKSGVANKATAKSDDDKSDGDKSSSVSAVTKQKKGKKAPEQTAD